MCGILLLAKAGTGSEGPIEHHHGSQQELQLPSWWSSMTEVCSSRGPHSLSSTTIPLQAATVHLVSSVLSLRGPSVTTQPITSAKGNFTLAWNGQIYSLQTKDRRLLPSCRASQKAIEDGENDGIVLARWIETAVQLGKDCTDATVPDQRPFRQVLPSILDCAVEGEWAFVLIDHETGDIYYARDPLGRRSLLVADSPSPDGHTQLLLASAASHKALSSGVRFEEVGCEGFWIWNQDHLCGKATLFGSRAEHRQVLRELQSDQQAIKSDNGPYPAPSVSQRQVAVATLHDKLLSSVRDRVTCIGGQVGQELSLSNQGSPIGLSSVAILFSGGLDSALLAWYAHLAVPMEQSIDLLNVAFENPRVLQAVTSGGGNRTVRSNKEQIDSSSDRYTPSLSSYSTPDRLLSIQTHSQLQALSPGRKWNLVEIDVSYSDYQAAREKILAHMHPCDSVMDLSLASVLWFASVGVGHLVQQGQIKRNYRTQARLYVSGLGADELCGGYSRHRKAFQGRGTKSVPEPQKRPESSTEDHQSIISGDWSALAEELQMDLDRLPTRNLGRDDRILSSHGREGRYPFLCSHIVTFLASLPLRLKCELGLEQGVGDKLLLRQLAKSQGLQSVSCEKKRAMQFGARSAKMEVGQGKTKGHMKLDNGMQESNSPQAAAAEAVVCKSTAPKDCSPTAPKEVFTTLCYYLKAPCPGQSFPEEAYLLPEALQSQYRFQQPKKQPESGPSICIHHLFEHVPLLERHLVRLVKSSQEMMEIFPDSWVRVEGQTSDKLKIRVLTALQDALPVSKEEDLKNKVAMAESSDGQERHRRRVRISLDNQGNVHIAVAKMAPWLPRVALSTTPPSTVRLDVQSTGPAVLPQGDQEEDGQTVQLQRRALYVHKTSIRDFYDAARERVGATLGLPRGEGKVDRPCFDVLMWNRAKQGKQLLTESSIANILLEIVGEEQVHETPRTPSSRWLTPRLTLEDSVALVEQTAFLPGLMRSYLLEQGLIEEADLSIDDLLESRGTEGRQRIWLCNALRGVWQVTIDSEGKSAVSILQSSAGPGVTA